MKNGSLTFEGVRLDWQPLFHLAGVVAQLVEHHNGIVGVRGSNPLGSTSLRMRGFPCVIAREVCRPQQHAPF